MQAGAAQGRCYHRTDDDRGTRSPEPGRKGGGDPDPGRKESTAFGTRNERIHVPWEVRPAGAETTLKKGISWMERDTPLKFFDEYSNKRLPIHSPCSCLTADHWWGNMKGVQVSTFGFLPLMEHSSRSSSHSRYVPGRKRTVRY